MKSVNTLVDELAENVRSIKSGAVTHNQAKEINNACGKVIHAHRDLLKYNEARKNKNGKLRSIDYYERSK